MQESWRWFGPDDPVSLDYVRQSGAVNIVTALHHIPIGDIWPVDEIRRRQSLINESNSEQIPLTWSVVESIPIHEDIKLGKKGCQTYIDNWIASMENLSECGIKTICYNFMPVIDWTRTDLNHPLTSGAYALSFDQSKFAAFDLFILQRNEALKEYSDAEIAEAKETYNKMSRKQCMDLTQTIISGLPGHMSQSYDLDDFALALKEYRDTGRKELQENLYSFLRQVIPRAEAIDVRLAIHPDDPPRELFGLPRIVSTREDLDEIFFQEPSHANGLTLCVGSLGSRADNDVNLIAECHSSRIHFAHLRSVKMFAGDGRSFYEADHLDGDTNMINIIHSLLTEECRRFSADCADAREIFYRPDHGHQMMDDICKNINPGYSAIGRLRGLAELRGAIRALSE